MWKTICGRREALGLLAFGTAAEWVLADASAHPATRKVPTAPPLPTVAIDPGHGGSDPGAVSPGGIYEKDIVLRIATEFARQLAVTRRFRTVLTRSTDEFVPLRERVARALSRRADLFLSIHVDALPNRQMRGISVFTLSAEASDKEAAALAINENKADLLDGIDLARQPLAIGNILMDLARRQTSNSSLMLAHSIVEQLGREAVLLDNPRRSADFAVLTAPDIPSVLVELGCLSNSYEERLLQQRGYQRQLARGLTRAVESYLAQIS
jgi:N-acetylmuramoyl-L-alanine amidase